MSAEAMRALIEDLVDGLVSITSLYHTLDYHQNRPGDACTDPICQKSWALALRAWGLDE